MSILNLNLSSFGLDITDRNIKLIQAMPYRDKFRLQAWGQVRLKKGIIESGKLENKEGLIKAVEELKSTINGRFSSELAVVGLPETKTFLKLFHLSKPEEIDKEKGEDMLVKAIEEELPKEIPLPLNSMLYDYHLLSENDVSWQVLVGSVPKDVVLEYTEMVKLMGFKPLALEIEAQAISRALFADRKKATQNKINSKKFKFSFKHKKKEVADDFKVTKWQNAKPAVIADLGASRSSLIVYHYDSVQFTRTLELSGSKLTSDVAAKLNLTHKKAEQAKIVCGLDKSKCKGQVAPLIRGWAQELGQELASTVTYYASLEGVDPESISKIILCGGMSALKGLPEILNKNLNVPVETGDPLCQFVPLSKNIKPIPNKDLLSFTTAVGLALR